MMSVGEKVYMDLMARGKDVETAKDWCRWIMKFEVCCGSKGKYERDDVIRYLCYLREKGYKQSSIEVMVKPVRLLAQIQGWSFPRLAMPKVREGDVRRPILSNAEVYMLIKRGKEVLSDRELAYVALSTTYGLRREELGSLSRIDGKVTVNTAKGGPLVSHMVPSEIKPYLSGYQSTGVRYMSRIFKRIIRKVGIALPGEGYGWHAIRRGLATEFLYRDVSLINVVRFMRWSDSNVKGGFGMLAIYGKRNQEEVDRSVFKVHPFLSIWNEGGN
jgi:hypothetical protein